MDSGNEGSELSDTARRARENALFLQASSIEGGDAARSAWLMEVCGDNADLRQRIEQRLTASSEETVAISVEPASSGNPALVSNVFERAQGPPLMQAGDAAIPFGEYELLEEIAHGAMGVVYRARQVRLNREVALKMIRGSTFVSGGRHTALPRRSRGRRVPRSSKHRADLRGWRN